MTNHICALRASADGQLFATSTDKETVKIWDAASLTEIASVKPGFSGRNLRLAIDPKNHRIYSGIWGEGLTCYNYSEHRAEWHRPDLIGIQQVDYSNAFPSPLFISLETPDDLVDEPATFSGVMELDAKTGQTKWQTEEASSAYLHPSQPTYALLKREAGRTIRIFDNSRQLLGSFPITYFDLLDVAFQGDLIALAEGQEGARLIDQRGSLLANYRPSSRPPNCLHVSFVGTSDTLAIFDNWEGAFVTQIDPTGQIITEYKRETSADICFIQDGTRFIDTKGQVCRTGDGIMEHQIQV